VNEQHRYKVHTLIYLQMKCIDIKISSKSTKTLNKYDNIIIFEQGNGTYRMFGMLKFCRHHLGLSFMMNQKIDITTFCVSKGNIFGRRMCLDTVSINVQLQHNHIFSGEH